MLKLKTTRHFYLNKGKFKTFETAKFLTASYFVILPTMSKYIFVLRAIGWKDKELIHKRALSCLQLVGIEKKAKEYANVLSIGEQQRVAIARALLNSPKLILADEPTGNLDPETSEEIMHLLIAVAKEEKTAILMATHDMQMVKKFPGRIIQVEDGGIKELS